MAKNELDSPVYFEPRYGSFVVVCMTRDELEYVLRAQYAPVELSEWDARMKMVHHMVDFQDDAFREWCDARCIGNPTNPVVARTFDMGDLTAMYEAFIQSWGVEPITLNELGGVS